MKLSFHPSDDILTVWKLPDEELFTALLLECGRPPRRKNTVFGSQEHFILLKDAAEKYWRFDLWSSYEPSSKLASYMEWLDKQ